MTNHKTSTVDRPDHYQFDSPATEVLDVIEDRCRDLPGELAYLNGNAIKYLLRWQAKGGREDLLKCRYHIDKLLERLPL